MALKIILCTVVLITVLLLAPLRIYFEYTGGVGRVRAKYLFVSVLLYPEKPKKKKKKRSKKKNPEGEKRKKNFWDTVSDIKILFDGVKEGAKWILHRVHLRFTADITVSGADAAEIALRYGEVHAAAGVASALLSGRLNTKGSVINVNPDFTGSQSDFETNGTLSILPVFLLSGTIRALIGIILLQAKNSDNNKVTSRKDMRK